MQWERRKPLWPVMAALGLLFALVLAAPRCWQSAVQQADVEKPAADPEPLAEPAVGDILAQQLVVESPEPLPPRREFDLEALLTVRDMVLAFVDQLPEIETTELQNASSRPAQVRVSSEGDRLAMLPPRESRNEPHFSSMSHRMPQPSSVLPTVREAQEFAATLLEAARSPEPTLVMPNPEPRLALAPQPAVPTLAPPLETLSPIPTLATAEPELAEPVNLVPDLAESELAVLRPVDPDLAEPENAYVEPAVPDLAEPEMADIKVTDIDDSQPSQQSTAPSSTEVPVLAPPTLKHRPQTLVAQLNELTSDTRGADWSQQVLTRLELLTEAQRGEHVSVAVTLDELEELVADGLQQSKDLDNPKYHNRWQQAARSLGRRVAIWRVLLDPNQPSIVEPKTGDSAALRPVLDDIVDLLQATQNGSDWREYLMLDQLAVATSEGIDTPVLTRAKLAQEVLSRMTDSRLTVAQKDFLTSPPLAQLYQELQPWAAASVDLETLTALVERYESSREMRYAAAIAQLQQRLKWSNQPQLQELAAHLDRHYRGANMRVAVSDELLNRMLPKQQPIVTPVRDRIAGAVVFGRSKTTTQLRVDLVPDNDAWNVGLKASGKVYSDTRSDTWPARIRNAAKLQYQGSKSFSLNEQGLTVAPAQVTAQGRNELVGVDSDFDPIPIVGFLFRDLARQKHKKSRPVALSQAKAKVVREVQQRMDSTIAEKVETWEERFRSKILAPIDQLALLAEPLDMHTTEDRAVMQLRLANSDQLAAHTLRPLAPSDSLLSMQMHETALNNALSGIGLDGRRMTILELFEFINQRLGKADVAPPDDLPKKAIIEFASQDAVSVRCDGDRFELIFSVVELAHRRDRIKNFQIHVNFRPVLNGLNVQLVRDGTLEFSGRRLKTGPRVVLHSIIGKVLVNDQTISLLNADVQQDPRLAGLMVTQLVLEDGWIGLALGPVYPSRTALKASSPEFLALPLLR